MWAAVERRRRGLGFGCRAGDQGLDQWPCGDLEPSYFTFPTSSPFKPFWFFSRQGRGHLLTHRRRRKEAGRSGRATGCSGKELPVQGSRARVLPSLPAPAAWHRQAQSSQVQRRLRAAAALTGPLREARHQREPWGLLLLPSSRRHRFMKRCYNKC